MKTIEERSKYFIGNNGEYAAQIYFSLKDAEKGLHAYIDCMDEDGKFVGSYKREGNYYTDDF